MQTTSYYRVDRYHGFIAIPTRFLYRLTEFISKNRNILDYCDIKQISRNECTGKQYRIGKDNYKGYGYIMCECGSNKKVGARAISKKTAVHCEGGKMCFTCPYPDCVCNDMQTKTEAQMLVNAGLDYIYADSSKNKIQ